MKEIKNFAVLKGSTQLKNGLIVHLEEVPRKNDADVKITGKAEHVKSEIRSDVEFYNGIVEFKAKFSDEDSGCLLTLNSLDEPPVVIGMSRDRQQFVFPSERGYSNVGSLKNYDLTKDIQFRVEALGSNMRLFVNGVLLGQGNATLKNSPLGFRLIGKKVQVHDVKFEAQKPKVFVVMQFSNEYDILYSDVIKPVCEMHGLDCIRADDFYTTTPILKDIIDSITNASLIIAEITPDNPNVFYEIGYAHALNKPTIILCDKKRDKLPFDLSGFRTLFYENSIGGKNKVWNDLKSYVESIFLK